MARLAAVVLAFVGLPLLAGCTGAGQDKIPAAARAVLDNAEQFELLSLDPDHRQRETPGEHFHGWKVLGKTPVADAGTRQRLVAALKRGTAENDGMVAACFNPRHGIRVTRGGETLDFVICFECLQAEVFAGEQRTGQFLTSSSPQPAFDEVLRAAGVPLPGQTGP